MKYFVSLLAFLVCATTLAQINSDYQKPPKEILELVDVPLAPAVLNNDDKDVMVLLYRDAYKSIEELSQTELRLGGLRIDPTKNIGSRVRYYNAIKIKPTTSKAAPTAVKGIPSNPKLSNFSWSPDQTHIAFSNTTKDGVSLWVLNINDRSAKKLTDAVVNANTRDVFNWFEDGKSILYKQTSAKREALVDTNTAVPTGPTISISTGAKAQNRTYQDLLQNKNDEFNFEQLTLTELHKVNLDGTSTQWLPDAMYNNISFSPDGNYVMVSTIEKPFSYLVPYYRFPSKTIIYTKDAEKIETVSEVPLIEDLPKGFMATREGRRSLSWRNDKPATLVFAKALDKGDPEVDVAYRDEVFSLDAPFNGTPKSLLKTKNRYQNITWGTKDIAIAQDYWWNTRNTKTYIFNPNDASQKPTTLFDRNYQDVYSNPGNFVTRKNSYGSNVLAMEGTSAFLIGDGYSDKGQFPFVDKLNLKTQKNKRLYESEYTDKLENIYDYDVKEEQLFVRIEAQDEYPNYYFKKLGQQPKQLTFFDNPFESLSDVQKEVIEYKRDDGLALSGTLYLPKGYDKDSKEKKPMILWAYPREYKDKASASQNTDNPNEFIYPYWGSPIYWATKGYVILDGASFPIVGEGETEPNDSFRTQLVANAKAAIDAVDDLGYIDRNRVAVGGHSYGAFMVANLLSHSDLFAAGIARSGAYNRTLTPFGFQSEQRSYWEAPEIYNTMSPFMHANKMKTPLLLTHGEADNNSGTYPLQSERYFNALKGHGAPVRLVMFPKESHGYSAKESILHLLWEQDRWLEEHLKENKISKTEKKEVKG